jgi:hypothetical protein
MRNKNSQNVKTLVDQANSGSTTVCDYPIVRNDSQSFSTTKTLIAREFFSLLDAWVCRCWPRASLWPDLHAVELTSRRHLGSRKHTRASLEVSHDNAQEPKPYRSESLNGLKYTTNGTESKHPHSHFSPQHTPSALTDSRRDLEVADAKGYLVL